MESSRQPSITSIPRKLGEQNCTLHQTFERLKIPHLLLWCDALLENLSEFTGY